MRNLSVFRGKRGCPGGVSSSRDQGEKTLIRHPTCNPTETEASPGVI